MSHQLFRAEIYLPVICSETSKWGVSWICYISCIIACLKCHIYILYDVYPITLEFCVPSHFLDVSYPVCLKYPMWHICITLILCGAYPVSWISSVLTCVCLIYPVHLISCISHVPYSVPALFCIYHMSPACCCICLVWRVGRICLVCLLCLVCLDGPNCLVCIIHLVCLVCLVCLICLVNKNVLHW